VLSVAVSPDGKYVISGSLDKTVKVWLLGLKTKSELEERLLKILLPIQEKNLDNTINELEDILKTAKYFKFNDFLLIKL